jgi:hypothetical protein
MIALLLVLGDRSAEAVEGGDAVELGEGLGVAGLVLDRLAIDQLGAVGDEGEGGDRGFAGVAGFGLASDAADQDDEVLHGVSPWLEFGGTARR